jgi:sigma-54 dependent transcriptional regulator, acetoin dehydrogenase operon transcriptional activator AcoR
MGDPADRRARLEAARAGFLDGAERLPAGVPDHVVASWRRSVSSGVRPGEVVSTFHGDLDRESRLVRCAGPVIEQLAEQVSDIPVCVALTDNQARLLARKDSTPWFGRVLDGVCFAEGFGYAEPSVGTNGVGTVLEFGESVQIVGAEHFVEPLQTFACAGAPVRDPLSGRIEGVLDISCHADHSSPLLHSLVRSAAAQIERNLLADRDQTQQALFDAYLRVDARTRHAVLAIGRRTVMANAALHTLLDPHDQQALQDHVRFVMARHGVVDDRVRLPSGSTVRLRGSRVTAGAELAGMVTVVIALVDGDTVGGTVGDTVGGTGGGTDVGDALVPAGRGRAELPAGPAARPARRGGCPAWRSAAATVAGALRAGTAPLLLGEPGTGRFTLLAALHHEDHPDGRVVALPPAEVADAPAEAAARLARERAPGVLHVLRDIDTLGAAAARELRGHLDRAPIGPLAATATDRARPAGPHEPLLGLFRASATLPPLRNRSADLAELVGALVTELAPHREVHLSRDAHRLVARYRWPGNVGQLREALTEALHRRPVGRIEAEDLPAYCHSAPRGSLRPVDELERDAIVAALREHQGNRVAGAAARGFARSTLYRKIRQYGITA